MGDVMLAARMHDPIAHSYKKLGDTIGASTAIGVGIIVTILTAGEGTVAVEILLAKAVGEGFGLIGLGMWLGNKVTNLLGKDEDAGLIKTAATYVWTEGKRSARMTDELKCADPTGTFTMMMIAGALSPLTMVFVALDMLGTAIEGGQAGEHPNKRVADGSDSVFIESRNAARIEDGTECGGQICKGAERTWIGREKVSLAGSKDRDESGTTLSWTFWILERIGQIPGLLLEGGVDLGINIAKAILGGIGDICPGLKNWTDWAKWGLDGISRMKEGLLKNPIKKIITGFEFAKTLDETTTEKPRVTEVYYPD
jgi:uncharacterized Zn-binding protein involved in type VI secretion